MVRHQGAIPVINDNNNLIELILFLPAPSACYTLVINDFELTSIVRFNLLQPTFSYLSFPGSLINKVVEGRTGRTKDKVISLLCLGYRAN